MKKKRSLDKKWYIVGLFLVVMLLSGCKNEDSGKQEEPPIIGTEDIKVEDTLYLITEHDTVEETLTLYNYKTGYEYEYNYTFSTVFKDKYGKLKTKSSFAPGKVVTMKEPDAQGDLTELQLSDKVWEYEDVRRFSIDEAKGVFTIAEVNYSILEGVMVFSDGKEIGLGDVSQNDILSVVGVDKKILSVVVTTGHGALSLLNTELFEGSLMQLNNDRFYEVTKNMKLEIPEGTYTLTVANNGWGGSCEITVLRGETTQVDLDSIKGEGKKSGLITFAVTPFDATVYLDNEEIDISKPVKITYGTHTLAVEAEGYEDWKKYLSVNSEKATLVITLTEEGKVEETESESQESESTEETQSTETEKDTQSESEKRQEELDDLQETINDIIENTFGGIFD